MLLDRDVGDKVNQKPLSVTRGQVMRDEKGAAKSELEIFSRKRRVSPTHFVKDLICQRLRVCKVNPPPFVLLCLVKQGI